MGLYSRFIQLLLLHKVMLIFMRHGERGDNEFPPLHSQIQYDPPLTEQAQKTITISAGEIATYFTNKDIGKFKLVSSPFLRCLMTAEKLSDQLQNHGFKEEGEVQVDYRISEYLRPEWFSVYPLRNLIIDKGESKQQVNIVERYLKRMADWKKREYNHEGAVFPENYGDFSKRIVEFKKTLTYPAENEALIYVTHGFVVRQICWRMNQVPSYKDQIKYGGYAVYINPSGTRDILLKSKL